MKLSAYWDFAILYFWEICYSYSTRGENAEKALKTKSLYPCEIQTFAAISSTYLVPPQGLEPWTPTLRVSCSTS